MESINIKNTFKGKLDLLFSTNFTDSTPFNRGYAVPEVLINNAIIFIGLNPSFRNGDSSGSFFYKLDRSTTNDIYFKPFREIAERCNVDWEHLDVLFIRETSQKIIEQYEGQYASFYYEQIMIAKEILELAEPKAIVVCNTVARRYMGKEHKNGAQVWMGYNFGAMQEDGTYRIQNPDSKLQGVPAFFSGMLSGQRALDIGSRERLVWHIKKVLQNG
jgi:hypothetical protein